MTDVVPELLVRWSGGIVPFVTMASTRKLAGKKQGASLYTANNTLLDAIAMTTVSASR